MAITICVLEEQFVGLQPVRFPPMVIATRLPLNGTRVHSPRVLPLVPPNRVTVPASLPTFGTDLSLPLTLLALAKEKPDLDPELQSRQVEDVQLNGLSVD